MKVYLLGSEPKGPLFPGKDPEGWKGPLLEIEATPASHNPHVQSLGR